MMSNSKVLEMIRSAIGVITTRPGVVFLLLVVGLVVWALVVTFR